MPSIKINGVTYVSNNSNNPYGEIASAYAQQAQKNLGTQEQQMLQQLATSKQGAAANFDSNAAQAYVNYAKQRNALPEQLRAQGINGGASESALVRMQNQFAQNQSANNAARSAAMAQLQNTYDTNLANLRNETNADILSNSMALAQQQAEYNDTQNQRALEQYSATIERFTSVKSVDKAISNLDPNDPNYTAKKQLLQLRKAQIKEAKGSGSGGSGGGSKKSGGGKKSSGGGSSKKTSSSKKSTKKTTSSKKKTNNAIVKGAKLTKSIAQPAYKNATKKKATTKKTTTKKSGGGKNTKMTR